MPFVPFRGRQTSRGEPAHSLGPVDETRTVSVPREDAEELPDRVRIELEEDGLYDAAETAILIGIRTNATTPEGRRKARQNAVYLISEAELPVIWSGPTGGLRRYLGRDVLRFRQRRRSDWGKHGARDSDGGGA